MNKKKITILFSLSLIFLVSTNVLAFCKNMETFSTLPNCDCEGEIACYSERENNYMCYSYCPGDYTAYVAPVETPEEESYTSESDTGEGIGIPNPISYDSFEALIDAVLGWFINITLVVAPLAIVYGGFLHITSAGDPQKSKQGKMVIFYAAIGLIVVLLATSLISIIKDLVVV